MREMWNPTYRAWFPKGPDDPDSAILTVTIDRVEYWDVPSSGWCGVWGVVVAPVATGEGG
jgi:general stress protein 26